jgi:hypothetical protein
MFAMLSLSPKERTIMQRLFSILLATWRWHQGPVIAVRIDSLSQLKCVRDPRRHQLRRGLPPPTWIK